MCHAKQELYNKRVSLNVTNCAEEETITEYNAKEEGT